MIILISTHMLFNHSLGHAPSQGNHIQGPSSRLCNFAGSSLLQHTAAADCQQIEARAGSRLSPRLHTVKSDQSETNPTRAWDDPRTIRERADSCAKCRSCSPIHAARFRWQSTLNVSPSLVRMTDTRSRFGYVCWHVFIYCKRTRTQIWKSVNNNSF